MKNKKDIKPAGKTIVAPPKESKRFHVGRKGDWVIAIVLAVALAFLSLHLTAGTYPEYLWETAELTPFFTTGTFFCECMSRAGGLLVWGASALTSLFHDPWLGAILFTALVTCLPFFLRYALRVPWSSVALCFVPSALLIVNLMQMGYMVVALTSPAVGFTAVLGTYAAALIVWGAMGAMSIRRATARRTVCAAYYVVMVVAAYPLFGYWGLAGTLISLVAVLCRAYHDKMSLRWAALGAVLVAIAVLAVPDILYRFFYTRVWEGEIYTIGLPKYNWDSAEQRLLYPLIALTALLAFMPLLRLWRDKMVVRIGSVIVAVAALVAVPSQTFADPAFYSALRMTRFVDDSDWDGVIREARRVTYKPSRLQGMLRMLAQVEQGTGPDEMFTYEEGDSTYASPRLMPYSALMGSRYMYYYLGKVNFCYRWCMEDMVAFGQRPTYLKYMVKCALVNNEIELAEKYIDGLRHTWAFRDYADKYEAYVRDTSLIAKDSEMKAVREYVNGYDNRLDSDGGLVEAYLVTMFSRLTGGSYKMGELSLLCNLMRKDLQGFWTRFHALLPSFKGNIPRHYQEAVLMMSIMNKELDISGVNIDNEMRQRMKEFISIVKSNGDNDELNKESLKAQFGDTYWYYFFFAYGV